jgi:hypothetical protein
MNTSVDIRFSRHANAFSGSLSLEDIRHRAPAVFAESAHERNSASYQFINKCGQPHLLINVATTVMWRST